MSFQVERAALEATENSRPGKPFLNYAKSSRKKIKIYKAVVTWNNYLFCVSVMC